MTVGMGMTINGKLDTNFSEATEAVGWRQVSDALAAAELYWLTTVRKDGRPHITPLIGRGSTTALCSARDRRNRRRKTSRRPALSR